MAKKANNTNRNASKPENGAEAAVEQTNIVEGSADDNVAALSIDDAIAEIAAENAVAESDVDIDTVLSDIKEISGGTASPDEATVQVAKSNFASTDKIPC